MEKWQNNAKNIMEKWHCSIKNALEKWLDIATIFYTQKMEGTPRTHESDVMQFCVIAIETAARKMNISPAELTMRLEEQGLIEGRLFKFYDTLHTQSANYVADDIIETLYNYEHEQ